MQYAPGYFYKTGAVDYTEGTLRSECGANVNAGVALADFLIWKYCFSSWLPDDDMYRVFGAFANSTNKAFPLPEELSYAKTWIYSRKKRKK